jgi:diguanylate cyclase (GGDEF)-like protein
MNEALGQPLDTVLPLIFEVTRQPIENISARCLREGRAVDLTEGVLLLRRDGTEVPIGDSAAPLLDRHGAAIGVVLVFHDVTERRRAVHKLTREAMNDSLTGLLGRREFELRLARLVAEAASGPAEHAMCYLDLDRFKPVNDLYGHEAGDNLIKTVGRLLTGRLRSRDTVARLGGDEFGVLLEHCSLAKAEEIAASIQQVIQDHPYVWEGKTIAIGASIGVVPITAVSGRATDILRAADAACYEAKAAGGNCVHLGQEMGPGIQQQIETRRITRLIQAVEKDHFQLFIQAIMPLEPRLATRPRCEILLRLPDEQGGMETHDSFLQHAERFRLIPTIDRWVVRKTVAILGAWHHDHPECRLPLCSINLSASSLDDLDLVPALREYLTQYRLPPEALCFEISEAAALGNFAELVRLLAEIRAAGCGFGLDDFGSGLASLSQLKSLPVDYLKIGGHYVRRVADDPVYGTLVSAVNDVGRIMGLTTIAEEVESESVLEKLRNLGVEYVQGQGVAPATPLIDVAGEITLPCIQRSE